MNRGKKPVRSPDDLKGLKLKTSGGLFDIIAKQYGIIGVTVASPEVYEATQRGIVEGNIFSYPSVKGYRINEMEKYHTYGARMGGFPWVYTINEKIWQKLPKEIQKTLMIAAKDYNKHCSENWSVETLTPTCRLQHPENPAPVLPRSLSSTGSGKVDPLTCPKCRRTMRIISFIEDREVIQTILKHLGLWLVKSKPVPYLKREPIPKAHAPPLGTIHQGSSLSTPHER